MRWRSQKIFRLILVVLVIVASATATLADDACSVCLVRGSLPAGSGEGVPVLTTGMNAPDNPEAGEAAPHAPGYPCSLCAHAAAIPSQSIAVPRADSLPFSYLLKTCALKDVSRSLFRPPKENP